ncbi:MAG: sulfur carrier protein ThiS adenylyltransferase ThiF [Methanomethylophilus sp.]
MQQVRVNGKTVTTACATVGELRRQTAPASDAAIADGYDTDDAQLLQDGMDLVFWQYGRMPPTLQMDAVLTARDTPRVRDRLRHARVGIAGLGGLGSHVAVMLARTGIGTLVLADYDRVDPTNLNRQDYTVADVGRPKTAALRDRLQQTAPLTHVELFSAQITAANAAAVFRDCGIVCEAFDKADQKAMLVETLLQVSGITVVSGSGLAGYGHADDIRTAVRMPHLIVCGDNHSAAAPGRGLMAPQVTVCAGHMADAVLKLLIDSEDDNNGQ